MKNLYLRKTNRTGKFPIHNFKARHDYKLEDEQKDQHENIIKQIINK